MINENIIIDENVNIQMVEDFDKSNADFNLKKLM